MSELVDCINALSAKDIIKSIAKTANGTPFYLQTDVNETLGVELVKNGTFDAGIVDWAGSGLGVSWEANFNGRSCIKATMTAVSGQIRQFALTAPQVENAKTYRTSGMIYMPSANTTTDGIRFRYMGLNQYATGVITPVQDGWVAFSVDYLSVMASANLYIYAYDGAAVAGNTIGDVFYLDNLSIREVL